MADVDPGLPHCVRLLNHLQGNQTVVQFSFNFLRKLRKGVSVKFHGFRNIKFLSFLNFRENRKMTFFLDLPQHILLSYIKSKLYVAVLARMSKTIIHSPVCTIKIPIKG